MVHRDIKPSNLMLTGSRESRVESREPAGPLVKILDMGLALLEDSAGANQRELTTTGQMMGTVEYMAPEQGMDSHVVDIRADIYALGATLYKLLAGEGPFSRDKYDAPLKVMMAKMTGAAPSLATACPKLPPELVALVDRMLGRSPEDRPSTPAEVAEALAPFADGADLKSLLDAACVDREADTAVDQSILATQEHLTRSSQETSPAVVPAPPLRGAASPPTTHQGAYAPRSPGRPLMVAAGLAAIVLLAGILFYIPTPHGTLVVEINDPSIKATVDDGAVIITEANDDQPFRVAAGEHKLHVAHGELRFSTEEFTLARGKELRLRVELVPGGVQVVHDDKVIGQGRLATPRPSSAASTRLAASPLDNVRREDIPPEALALAGNGDPKRAQPQLVAVLGWKASEQHSSGPVDIDVRPGGAQILSSGFGGRRELRLWDTATGQLARVIQGYSQCADYSPDGGLLATSQGGKLAILNAETFAVQRVVDAHSSQMTSVAFSHDGRQVATAGNEGSMKVWDASNGELLFELGGAESGMGQVAFSRDGRWFAYSPHGEDLLLYDAAQFKLRAKWKASGRWLTFSPDSVFVGQGNRIWRVANPDQPPELVPSGDLADFGPQGAVVLTSGGTRLPPFATRSATPPES
jgi:WD40 repeat protein